jgi:hypothetical protein
MPRPRNPRDVVLFDRVDRRNTRRSATTPRSIFRRAILSLLWLREGHEMRSREVRAFLAERMENQFTAADLAEVRSGQPKWVNNMQWERKKMVMEGLMETTLTAGHGVWRLTPRGIAEARPLRGRRR